MFRRVCTAKPLKDVGTVAMCKVLSEIIEEKGMHQKYQCDGAICTKHSMEREMFDKYSDRCTIYEQTPMWSRVFE